MSSVEPRGWSLQRRLAWQLVLAIGLLLGGLFVLLDVLVDRAMYRHLDQFLSARAEALAAGIATHERDEVAELLPAYDLAGHAEFFAIYEADGRLRVASANSLSRPLPAGPMTRTPHYADITLPDGHLGRAIGLRLPDGGWLVMGTERESWDRTERTMHGVLLAGSLLAVMLAVALCLLLLRRAFASMALEAERLREDANTAALPPSQAPRELQPFIRAAHDALRQSRRMTERERRFSRNVAHELRTPVAEIRLAGEHALMQGDDDSLREGLLRTQRANARMARGIEALLALARYESGQEPPTPDPLDLVALLRQQMQAVLHAEGLPAERIELIAPADAWVHCDAGMLERIVANLLQNAVEYGDAGQPVRAGIVQDADAYRIEIRNRAAQLQPADLARFGERHWRGQRDGDARHAGLGLALVHGMADALQLPIRFDLAQGELVATLGPLPAL